jgi:hypothetical protein
VFLVQHLAKRLFAEEMAFGKPLTLNIYGISRSDLLMSRSCVSLVILQTLKYTHVKKIGGNSLLRLALHYLGGNYVLSLYQDKNTDIN